VVPASASLVAGAVALVFVPEMVASDEAEVEEVVPASLVAGTVALVEAPEVVASDEAEVVVLPP